MTAGVLPSIRDGSTSRQRGQISAGDGPEIAHLRDNEAMAKPAAKSMI